MGGGGQTEGDTAGCSGLVGVGDGRAGETPERAAEGQCPVCVVQCEEVRQTDNSVCLVGVGREALEGKF